ncbi:hypothetical protein MHB40_13260 [Lysinibacillus sp. FSL K6-0057]|uniref:hypothetical protein n=1 Tax=unclassified Lysinibacillus TaxID=2636778 RepID=UPI0024807155|nr:hypothetical protein [Lysinibacillus sp. 1 U-2021]WGT37699.1 hypothetical protein QH639_17930 [Lysinibacillus sp. 1 U-2021]
MKKTRTSDSPPVSGVPSFGFSTWVIVIPVILPSPPLLYVATKSLLSIGVSPSLAP